MRLSEQKNQVKIMTRFFFEGNTAAIIKLSKKYNFYSFYDKKMVLYLAKTYQELRLHYLSNNCYKYLLKNNSFQEESIIRYLTNLILLNDFRQLNQLIFKYKSVIKSQWSHDFLEIANIIADIRLTFKEIDVQDIFPKIINYSRKYSLNYLFNLDRLAIPLTNQQLLTLAVTEAKHYNRLNKSVEHKRIKNKRIKNKRIKVAYISPDFYGRPTGFLMKKFFKYHNSEDFDVYIFCRFYYKNDHVHQEIKKYHPKIFYFVYTSVIDIVHTIQHFKIDILVDIMGLMSNHNLSLLSYHAAPVQITWLAYPGTLGSKHVDYNIADKIVIPPEERQYYSEKIIYMPECYQLNDDSLYADINIMDKLKPQEENLPSDWNKYFILGHMNMNYKIDFISWNMWIKIMKLTQKTLLVVIIDIQNNDIVKKKLINSWLENSIDKSRLIFWDMIERNKHYARLKKFISLGLDTHYCNSHTTGNDILINGIPLITLPYNTFAGSVAKSLLNTLQLPELIMTSQQQYIDTVVALSKKPDEFQKLQSKVKYHISRYNLFNTKRYVKHFESALQQVWNNYLADIKENIEINPISEFQSYKIVYNRENNINSIEIKSKSFQNVSKLLLHYQNQEVLEIIICNHLNKIFVNTVPQKILLIPKYFNLKFVYNQNNKNTEIFLNQNSIFQKQGFKFEEILSNTELQVDKYKLSKLPIKLP